jgi:hypothetical protein
MGVVGKGVARGFACAPLPRRLHIPLCAPCYYLRRRSVADIDVDGGSGQVKVSTPVGGSKGKGSGKFEQVLMVSTGKLVEYAREVLVARRKDVFVYAPFYPSPRAYFGFQLLQSAKQGREVGV